MKKTAAILLAAGSGRRMCGAVADKILAALAGRPVFAYSVAAFVDSGIAGFYAGVYRDADQLIELARLAPTPAVFVQGGRARQDSVANARAALPDDIEYVFIHDCARPLIRPAQLTALARAVRRQHAVVLAHRVIDTIRQVPPGRGRRPRSGRAVTLDRDRLWAMETPQVFSRDLIVRAYARAQRLGLKLTDDAQAVEQSGQSVAFLENPHPNPKLTAPGDLAVMAALCASQDSGML